MDEMPPREPSSQPNESLTRRGFYIGAIYGMGAAIMVALGGPALAYLLLPPKLRKSDEWVEAGDITRLTPRIEGGAAAARPVRDQGRREEAVVGAVADAGEEIMKRRWEALREWLEHRTGVQTAVRQFLYEEIPASSGWHQIFGSVAVFLFLTQAFTGVLLAFNYAPTPGEAYNSLRYILTEVTGGRLIRGLHHWGASMMIVVVALHMTQAFLYGAYKKPREATWIVGVVLLLLTLAYGLTGYLLPWDNRAYWGTVVATQIAGQAPVLGPYLTRLLGGSGGIGVVTFARFYGLHVLLLPPATLFLIALHIYLVRKHGVAPAPGDEALPRQQFFPRQLFKDTVAIFLAFAVLFLMAVVVRVPLEQLADDRHQKQNGE